jgi:hypothetical protein
MNSESAKEVLYPGRSASAQYNPEDDDKHRVMYAKTHGNFMPGEQKTREYNW